MALVGCGGAAAPDESPVADGEAAGGEEGEAADLSAHDGLGPSDERELDDASQALIAAEQELADTLSQAGGGRCGEAQERLDALCELATRICAIADRHPEHEPARAQCDDGNARCARAMAAVADACVDPS